MIEVQNLVKYYGDAPAVSGISFSVQPGEVVGLLGPNGAGKSTTQRILTGYIPFTSGLVKTAGIPVREDPLAARQQIGYLSENNPLYESLGVWECLELYCGFRHIPVEERQKRIDTVTAQCALEDVVSKDVSELSKGYRQRLGLALAILHDPAILILDEPTSSLDPIQQKEVRRLILALKQKKTVLLSTHILSEAQKLCDRIYIIHQGKIIAQGTVEELESQAKNDFVFYIRLKGPQKEIMPALQALPGLKKAEYSDEKEPGCPGFLITSHTDLRLPLFEMSSKRTWPIMELKQQSATLDDIFHSLTEKQMKQLDFEP